MATVHKFNLSDLATGNLTTSVSQRDADNACGSPSASLVAHVLCGTASWLRFPFCSRFLLDELGSIRYKSLGGSPRISFPLSFHCMSRGRSSVLI